MKLSNGKSDMGSYLKYPNECRNNSIKNFKYIDRLDNQKWDNKIPTPKYRWKYLMKLKF